MANEGPTAEALTDIYAHVGMLFSVLQGFKYQLATLITDHRPIDETVPPEELLDADWASVVDEFCAIFPAPDDVTGIVKTVPSLVHFLTNHCFYDNTKLMSSDDGCYQLRDELQQFYEGIVVYSAFLKDIENLKVQGAEISWDALKREHDWRRFSETLEPPRTADH